jgi:transposase
MSYPEEFRAEAVALYRRTDRSIKQVAEDLGVSYLTLRHWVDQDAMKRKKHQAPRATTAPTKETVEQKLARFERENAKLQRENEQLRMDREILKKAAAFFAKESE